MKLYGVVSRLLVALPGQGLMETPLQSINLCRALSHQSTIIIYVYDLQYGLLLKHCIFLIAIKMVLLYQIISLSTTNIMVLY